MQQSRFCIARALGYRSLSTAVERDFFGIHHVTSKDICGAYKSATKLPHNQISDKYNPLQKKRYLLSNKEKEVNAIFASIRFDDDNVPSKHGQFEVDNGELVHEPSELEQIYIDPVERVQATKYEEDPGGQHSKIDIPGYNEPYKVADVKAEVDMADVLQLFKQSNSAEIVNKYANKPPLIFYFEAPTSSQEIAHERPTDSETLPHKLTGYPVDNDEIEQIVNHSLTELDSSKPTLNYEPALDKIPLLDLDPNSREYEERQAEIDHNDAFDKSIDDKYDYNEKHISRPKKAIEHLEQIRSQKVEPMRKNLKEQIAKGGSFVFRPVINLDSKGFHDYSEQVPDWSSYRHVEALDHMRNSILYNNYDILAVNKPYGMASHADESGNNRFNVNSLIGEIAKEKHIEKVYLAHRLDATTTGVLLFATSKKRAENLNKLFNTIQIKKTYWCITTNLPKLNHAIIDIPIGEFEIAGKARQCLVPDSLDRKHQLSKGYRHAKKAVTEYRVLADFKGAALMEVKPTTGVRHQIRCHLSFGINCPILGDHKYSHLERLAPQVLPVPMLKALKLRQQKVRTLPMHLHAKSIVIPDAKANGETLFINAPIPAHFSQNMQALRLQPKTK